MVKGVVRGEEGRKGDEKGGSTARLTVFQGEQINEEYLELLVERGGEYVALADGRRAEIVGEGEIEGAICVDVAH